MLRSQTVNTIYDLHIQGKSVQEIAQQLGISRTTTRKYLKHPEAVLRKPRAQQPSKLDPFHEQIKQWVMQDHCTNCEVLFVRLQKLGYTGAYLLMRGVRIWALIHCGKTGAMMPLTSSKGAFFALFSRKR